jgi:thioredoxin-related protein
LTVNFDSFYDSGDNIQISAAYFNKNYVNYKFDMEKGEGPKFAKTYTVAAYPTLLFFNPSGELIHKAVGGRDSETFVTLGEDAMNPEKQVFTMKKKFEVK